MVGTAHAEQHTAGVQVKDTDPVNPPNPVMITGNDASHAFGHTDGCSGDREVPRLRQSAGR